MDESSFFLFFYGCVCRIAVISTVSGIGKPSLLHSLFYTKSGKRITFEFKPVGYESDKLYSIKKRTSTWRSEGTPAETFDNKDEYIHSFFFQILNITTSHVVRFSHWEGNISKSLFKSFTNLYLKSNSNRTF